MKNSMNKRAFKIALSIAIGVLIIWILLREIDPREIPRVISKIPLQSLIISFALYSMAIFLKAYRFKMILRSNIGMRHLFPIISSYMFFANILPMRSGELSYIYLMKKQARVSGTKSFASLIIGGIADILMLMIAMFIVGWHLKSPLARSFSNFFEALEEKLKIIPEILKENLVLLFAFMLLFLIIVVGFLFFKFKIKDGLFIRYLKTLNSKISEVKNELKTISFDLRFVTIIFCSILIIVFRFVTQWYLVRSMELDIDIWELSFALLFGVLFSFVPIHGPAGFGTVEAPWVMALLILNVPQNHAIASGFGLHIIIIMYCIILGIYGILSLKFMPSPSFKQV